nr:Histidine phosphatase superfamily (branch 1) [uncultured bacterium]AIA19297.1 Histidine phosphatase superfamily (branch 1) [uncultured bacterium]
MSDAEIWNHHGLYGHNARKTERDQDPDYKKILELYRDKQARHSEGAQRLAKQLVKRYPPQNTNEEPLNDQGCWEAEEMGERFDDSVNGDVGVVLVSPYRRARMTTAIARTRSRKLQKARLVVVPMLREQEFGLQTRYGDGIIYRILHPEEDTMLDLLGDFNYRYPGGESKHDLYLRIAFVRHWAWGMFPGLRKFFGAHHLGIICAHLEVIGFDENVFAWLDEGEIEEQKIRPRNCSLTTFDLNPSGLLVPGRYYDTLLHKPEDYRRRLSD